MAATSRTIEVRVVPKIDGRYRRDDISDFIADIEQTADNAPRKPKVLQRWTGSVAVPLRPGKSAQDIIAALPRNVRWHFHVSQEKLGVWAMLWVEYTAKGANADDAERKIAAIFDVNTDQVAVYTERVIPVASL